MKPLVLWGGTGQAVVLNDFVETIGYKTLVVVDNNSSVNSPLQNIKVVFKLEGLKAFLNDVSFTELSFAVAIGGSKGKERLKIGNILVDEGISPTILIHPRACISKSVSIAQGTQLLASCNIGPKVELLDYVIVNTAATVEHECFLGKGVHIGPGAILAGLVYVDDFTFIGAGAVVMPRVRIGKNTIIGAGSVVTKDVPDDAVYFGNPAKYYKDNVV